MLCNFAWVRYLCDGELAETLCGEPDFMAPEVVRASGHGFAADWWALGVRLYYMITGASPWSMGMGLVQNEISTFQSITAHEHGNIRLRGPRSAVGVQQDLCNALLHPDPSRRLVKGDDLQHLFAHKFFDGIDADGLEAGTFPSPLLQGAEKQMEQAIGRARDPADRISTEPCDDALYLADGDANRFADIFIQ